MQIEITDVEKETISTALSRLADDVSKLSDAANKVSVTKAAKEANISRGKILELKDKVNGVKKLPLEKKKKK